MRMVIYLLITLFMVFSHIPLYPANLPDIKPRPPLINSIRLFDLYMFDNEKMPYFIDRVMLYYENDEYIWFFSVQEINKGWSFYLVNGDAVIPLEGERLDKVLIQLRIKE